VGVGGGGVGGGSGAVALGSRVKGTSKWTAKMYTLTEKSAFLSTKIVKVLTKVTRNSIIFFFKFIISVKDRSHDYSPWTPKTLLRH